MVFLQDIAISRFHLNSSIGIGENFDALNL